MKRSMITSVMRLIAAALMVFMAVPMSALGQAPPVAAAVPGGTLDPTTVTQFVTPLLVPPAMPPTPNPTLPGVDYYEIAVRQFQQQMLPAGMPATTVWGYGSVQNPATFNSPSYTIEATYNTPVRVKWINDLKDPITGNYLPHLLPIDQTIHWANPPGGVAGRDMQGTNQTPYTGPVPIITHLHGAHVTEESDGFPTAWYLPAATNTPAGYATEGTAYAQFKAEAEAARGQAWDPGTAVFQYPNDQRAATLWYHDHTLGMTRANVYAAGAGFYLLRGGPDDVAPGVLPSGAYEIPLAIQDKSFNADGSLFYPDNRAFFEGLTPAQLQIPFMGDAAIGGPSEVAPIWNPEFFGNTILVNGNTWPYLEVEPRQYRFRLLNASDSRFYIFKMDNAAPFWVIGTDGGFLPAPVQLSEVLLGPGERADVIVDFTGQAVGANILLENIGPDEPYGGGVPGVDFVSADPLTTGKVMQFRVVAATGPDTSTPVATLGLPALTPLGASAVTRQVSLNEEESMTVFVTTDINGNLVLTDPALDPTAVPFGPTEAMLGTVDPLTGLGVPLEFFDPVTEQPSLNGIETWEIKNFTADAHPIHLHLVEFQVIEREDIATATVTGPEAWEVGFKDTVVAYPGQITRVKAQFDLEGLYVWHCHILSHEDNEMMRPFYAGSPPAAPTALAATLISATQVDLTWTDNSANESGFRIERSLNNFATAPGASFTVAFNQTSFSDTTVAQPNTYSYRVVAFNAGGDSTPSNTTTIQVDVPAAPTDLTAIVMSATRVDLVWTDQSDTETGFRVERSLDNFATAPSATFPVAANLRIFSDTSVAATNTYAYRVVALNVIGSSAPSNIATTSVTTRLVAGPIDPTSVYQGNPNTGSPGFYQDDQGTRVSLRPIAGNGLTPPTLIFDPPVISNPYSVFLGFGTEAFYYYAESVFFMPNGGLVVTVFGLEHAFGGAGNAAPGQEFVFNRTRIRVDVPIAGTYTVQHPYGTEVFNVTTPGGRAINYTADIGVPRDFAAATTGVMTRFLQPTAPSPAGWIGDGASIGTVTGSPTGFNKIRITGPVGSNIGGIGIDFYETDQFMVSGRLATAVTPLPSFTRTIDPVTGVAPVTVSFTDTTTGVPTKWVWDFGDGSPVSNLQNPTHIYSAAGNYTVRLTVTNAAATVSTSQTVSVSSAPVAGFTHTPPNGLPPVAINFTDTSTGAPTSWLWDFGDGATSNVQNPSHTYAAAGTYTVTLTVTGPAGAATTSQPLSISANLLAGFTVALAPANGVAPVTATFTDTSVGAITGWLWNFGDGSPTSTLQNPPPKVYSVAGNYTVTLTVTDAAGSAGTSLVVSVYSAPVASFTKVPAFGPVPLTVNFTDTSTGNPVSWAWNFGDGTTSTLKNPAKTYNTFGRYPVTLTVTNPAGTAPASQTVIVSTVDPATLKLGVGPIDPNSIYPAAPAGVQTGLPSYYEDDQATRVSLLPLTAGQVFDPPVLSNPYSVFLGYGTEAFYYLASATVNTSVGRMVAGFGIEAAFGGAGNAVPGQEFVFNRTRIVADVPVAGTYTFQHPYGTEVIQVTAADVAGGGGIFYTADVGVPRDFLAAAANGNISRFLRPTAPQPAGWLGTGVVGTATGSPLVPAFNKVRLTGPVGSNLGGPGIDFVETDQFSVTARMATGLAPSFTKTLVPPTGVAPVIVTFTDTSTGGPTSWLWNFGDGTTSTLQNPPAKTYNVAGNYTVTLTISDGVGTISTSQVVSVFSLPAPSFTKSAAAGAAPLTVSFTDTTTGNPTSWLWNFGDGSPTSALQHPVKTYTAAGIYTVTLTATNASGFASTSQTVTVTGLLVRPAAPTVLTATPVSATQVNLTWTDNANNEDGFRIWRSGLGVAEIPLSVTGADITAFSDLTVVANTTYNYRVEAFNVVGFSASAGPVAVTTPVVGAGAPTPVQLTGLTSTTGLNVDATGVVLANATLTTPSGASTLNIAQGTRLQTGNGQPLTSLSAAPLTAQPPAAPPQNTVIMAVEFGPNGASFNPPLTVTMTYNPALLPAGSRENKLQISWWDTVNARWLKLNSAVNVATKTITAQLPHFTTVGVLAVDTPLPPSGLEADVKADGEVELSWTDNSANEDGFNIERATDGVTFTEIDSVAADVTVFSDNTAAPLTTYQYRVAAFNVADDSSYTDVVTATTPAAATAPARPTGVMATATRFDRVVISWTPGDGLADGFRIERFTGSAAFSQVGQVSGSATEFTDNGVEPLTQYTYRVIAFNAIGVSAASDTVQATTPVGPDGVSPTPPPPGGGDVVVVPPPAPTPVPTPQPTPVPGPTPVPPLDDNEIDVEIETETEIEVEHATAVDDNGVDIAPTAGSVDITSGSDGKMTLTLPVPLPSGSGLKSFDDPNSGTKLVDDTLTMQIKDAAGNVVGELEARLDKFSGTGSSAQATIISLKLKTREQEQDFSASDASAGKMSSKVELELKDLPNGATLNVTVSRNAAAAVQSAFVQAADAAGKTVKEVAFVMDVQKTNLQNVTDIDAATITMKAPPSWVKAQGRPGSIKIVRVAENGEKQVLDTTVVVSADGQYTFVATSAGGLSTFGLAALQQKDGPLYSGEVEVEIEIETEIEMEHATAVDDKGVHLTANGTVVKFGRNGEGKMVVTFPVPLPAGSALKSFDDNFSGTHLLDDRLVQPLRNGADDIVGEIETELEPNHGTGVTTEAVVKTIKIKTREQRQDFTLEDRTVGVVTGHVEVEMHDLPAAGAGVTVTVDKRGGDPARAAFDDAANAAQKQIEDIAFVMDVHKNLLENVKDLGAATIVMQVSSEWVKAHGGAANIKIARFAETGEKELLETRVIGEDAGMHTFAGTSPAGLSTFGLVAVQDYPPTVTITAPANGATLAPGDVTVTVSVENLTLVPPGAAVAGEGHLHYYLDVDIPTTQGQPAVTAPGTYKAQPGTSATWTNLATGTHRLGVQLVASNHVPLDPPVTAMVTVTVAAVQPTATPVPQPTATLVPQPTGTPASQPTATPVPQPTATSAPQPTSTAVPQPTAAPQPTATPVPTTEPTPTAGADGTNWGLIVGVIAVVVVLLVLGGLMMRRRTTS